MKSLIVFARIIIVGCLWSIVFVEGIRVILLCNWHFDIFWPPHWRQAKMLWDAGWVARAPKEWAFVIILITFIPMLITGWWTLCMVAWENIIYDIITLPLTLYRKFIKTPLNVMTTNNKYGVVKKKSYKEVRPAGIGYRMPISDYGENSGSSFNAGTSAAMAASRVSKPAAPAALKAPKKPDIPSTIDHALFRFDDDDDDFDLDIDSFEKTDILKKKENKKARTFDEDDDDAYQPERRKKTPEKRSRRAPVDDEDEDDEDYSESADRNSRGSRRDDSRKAAKDDDRPAKKQKKDDKNSRQSKNERTDKPSSAREKSENDDSDGQHSPVYDILRQKGYDVISNVIVKDTVIDYVGVSESSICLCLVDKENGDWLADEELFNGEEPLWFSENSHRVSPVRKLDVARGIIEKRLENEEFEQELKAYMIVQMANIINADDMFEVWDNLNIHVTRVNRGAPKDIALFSKSLEDAGNSITKKELDLIRKFFKNGK